METSNAPDRQDLLRAYADGRMTWHDLRQQGFDDYVQVLAGLGELGLRPPMAAMTGPNVEARRRGIALLKRLLAEPSAR